MNTLSILGIFVFGCLISSKGFAAPVVYKETIYCFEEVEEGAYQQMSYAATLAFDEDMANWKVKATRRDQGSGGYVLDLESPEVTLGFSGRSYRMKFASHAKSTDEKALLARRRAPRGLPELYEKIRGFDFSGRTGYREPGNFTIQGSYELDGKTGHATLVYKNGALRQLSLSPEKGSLVGDCTIGLPIGK